ncbi:MAG: hypothetical protein ABW082_14275 [Sedimenticola sp.]
MAIKKAAFYVCITSLLLLSLNSCVKKKTYEDRRWEEADSDTGIIRDDCVKIVADTKAIKYEFSKPKYGRILVFNMCNDPIEVEYDVDGYKQLCSELAHKEVCRTYAYPQGRTIQIKLLGWKYSHRNEEKFKATKQMATSPADVSDAKNKDLPSSEDNKDKLIMDEHNKLSGNYDKQKERVAKRILRESQKGDCKIDKSIGLKVGENRTEYGIEYILQWENDGIKEVMWAEFKNKNKFALNAVWGLGLSFPNKEKRERSEIIGTKQLVLSPNETISVSLTNFKKLRKKGFNWFSSDLKISANISCDVALDFEYAHLDSKKMNRAEHKARQIKPELFRKNEEELLNRRDIRPWISIPKYGCQTIKDCELEAERNAGIEVYRKESGSNTRVVTANRQPCMFAAAQRASKLGSRRARSYLIKENDKGGLLGIIALDWDRLYLATKETHAKCSSKAEYDKWLDENQKKVQELIRDGKEIGSGFVKF